MALQPQTSTYLNTLGVAEYRAGKFEEAITTLSASDAIYSASPAGRELAIAKFWASEGGHRVCYAAQHLHGGIGVDKDYPLHHFYLQSRKIELTLGGAHTHLTELGRQLAKPAQRNA